MQYTTDTRKEKGRDHAATYAEAPTKLFTRFSGGRFDVQPEK